MEVVEGIVVASGFAEWLTPWHAPSFLPVVLEKSGKSKVVDWAELDLPFGPNVFPHVSI